PCQHRPIRTMDLAHFEYRITEPDLCMRNRAARLRAVDIDFLRTKGLLQKVDQFVGANRMQVGIDRPQTYRDMADTVMCRDVPVIPEGVFYTARAFPIRHLLYRVERGRTRVQRPSIHTVCVGHVKVNRSRTRWILLIPVAKLDHRITEPEFRVHDAVSFRRGNAEFLFRSEHFFYELDELRRASHDDIGREGMEALTQVQRCCYFYRHCFLLQLNSEFCPKCLARHATQTACDGKQFPDLRVRRRVVLDRESLQGLI